MEVVAVLWEDASFDEEGSAGEDVVRCCTFGVVTAMDDDKVVLVSELNHCQDGPSERYKHVIPRSYIKRIVPLKPVRGRGRAFDPFA